MNNLNQIKDICLKVKQYGFILQKNRAQELTKKLLLSGGINTEDYYNNNREGILARIITVVVLRQIADEMMPVSQQFRNDINNLMKM